MPSASPSPDPAPGPRPIRRVAIVFAGGPAPAANAVISTAAASFLRHGIEVLGILHGYAHLVEFGDDHPMEEGRDYMVLDQSQLKRTRNTRGILIGTSRTNPGKDVSSPAHLKDPERTAMLRRVHRALDSLGVDALISIGGDDTLKTANKFKRFQDYLPADARRIAVVHVPKTIDNDYRGIDFTFGYFTAVEFLASEIRNLLADAEAGRDVLPGRDHGPQRRLAGVRRLRRRRGQQGHQRRGPRRRADDRGDAHRPQDRPHDHPQGHGRRQAHRADRPRHARREQEGKEFGAIVLAEGLAQYLPSSYLQGAQFDEHGHISLPQTELAKSLSKKVEAEYQKQTGRKRRVTGVQLGYEARCALPHAFDVILGSQLGVGSYRALVENGLDGVLVSVAGQLNLNYVPFEELVDPETLVTVVRTIQPGSDFQRLARFLENYPHD